jgi:hypothetical protein
VKRESWGERLEIQRMFLNMGRKNEEKIRSPVNNCLGWREMEQRGKDKRALKMGDPFSSLNLSPPPFRLPLPNRLPIELNIQTGPPAVSVLPLSLRLARNSQSMFPRFLTGPTYQHFVADFCVSPTRRQWHRHLTQGHFAPKPWVMTTWQPSHQVYLPQA